MNSSILNTPDMHEFEKIHFSRHARRRMKLYGISEEEVLHILRTGKAERTKDDKIVSLGHIEERFSYPIKVISAYRDTSLVIVSAYPFKRRKRHESKLR
jgi:hypothetical protein